ncbi:MAG: hypothetical protein AAF560_14445 [Acidobacteriota bacterium]
MLRRTFLLAGLALLCSPFGRPAAAIGFQWFARASGVGARLIRGVRAASKSSPAFHAGIQSVASSSSYEPVPPTRLPKSGEDPRVPTRRMDTSERSKIHKSIERSLKKLDDDLSQPDRDQLAQNIWDLMVRISDVMDLKDALHLVDLWGRGRKLDVVAARIHVTDCSTCRNAFLTLKRGTDLEMIPITNPLDS